MSAPLLDRHAQGSGLRTSILRMLELAPPDRRVAPVGQPFAFRTHRGCVREENQDTALVLAGRRSRSSSPFLAGIVCDGMGGMAQGRRAAHLAAAAIAAEIAVDDEQTPWHRLNQALLAANAAIFGELRGGGAVVVVALIEDGHTTIAWVGDARVYSVDAEGQSRLLTEDDSIAAVIARAEGSAPEADRSLLSALGTRERVEPHVDRLDFAPHGLLLLTDGVHQIEEAAMAWVLRRARDPVQLADRLVEAALWEGGHDNATALALCPSWPPLLDETNPLIAAWAQDEPRIWLWPTAEPSPAPGRSSAGSTASEPPRSAPRPASRDKTRAGSRRSNPRGEQPPLIVEPEVDPKEPR